jgi:hypothetical protein
MISDTNGKGRERLIYQFFGVKWRALELERRTLLFCAESSPLEKTLASLFIRARNQWYKLSSIKSVLYWAFCYNSGERRGVPNVIYASHYIIVVPSTLFFFITDLVKNVFKCDALVSTNVAVQFSCFIN